MFRPPPLCFHRPTKDALKCELVLLRPQGHLWIQVLCLLKPGTCVAKPRGDFHEINHWVSLNKGLIKGTWFLGGGGNWGSPLRLPWWLKNNRWHRCLHIGLFLDPLLIYLLVSVSSILTLRYICWFPLNDVCDIYVLESGKWCKRHVWICFLALKKNISLASRARPKQDVC